MKKSIIGLILLLGLINASLDQSYQHTLLSNGTSVVSRTMDVEMLTGPLLPEHINQIDIACKQATSQICNFDKGTKQISVTQNFGRNNEYYEVVETEGFPLSSTTLVIKKLPTDKLGNELIAILKQAGISLGSEAAGAVDLNADNKLGATYLKGAKVSITYVIKMPMGIATATSAGTGGALAQIEGNKATFDVAEVMLQPGQMNIVGKEINLVPMALIVGVLVLGAFAASFYMQERKENKKKIKKPQK